MNQQANCPETLFLDISHFILLQAKFHVVGGFVVLMQFNVLSTFKLQFDSCVFQLRFLVDGLYGLGHFFCLYF